MELRTYQREAIDAVYDYLREHDDNPCVVLPTGCHAAGHPILMWDGTVKPVEDVAVGDLIMGPDSEPRQVLELCRGEDELFCITPLRGEPFVVNGDHILSLVCTSEGRQKYPSRCLGGEIDNVTVREYLAKSKSWRHLRKLYRVSVDFSGNPCLPIPPYILGLLLGDGSLESGTTSLTTADEAIARAWMEYAAAVGCDVHVRDHDGRCPTYRLRRTSGKYNFVTEALSVLGLAGTKSATKFIPQSYQLSSRADRLQLFAGLIDSDGSATKGGIDYVTQSIELAGDIVFLARSLGFWAKATRKYCACQTGAGGWYYRLSIWGDFSEVPIRLKRRIPQERRMNKSVLRTGFNVDSAGHGAYFGFVLDGDHLYVDGNFIVHHNSGKTPVLATICKEAVGVWGGRVIILAHVKELLEQAADKLNAICPEIRAGVYSAGLGSRDTEHPVIIAGIQSVFRRARELGHFDLCLIDECHLLPPDGEGMYRSFLADLQESNPQLRVIGLTATPYRMTSGMICGPDNILQKVCFEIGVKELIRDGYLCPLISKAGKNKADVSSLHVRAGEYKADEVEAMMDADDVVRSAVAEIVEQTADRNSCLIFASGVAHAKHIVQVFRSRHGIECGFVCGDTPAQERAEILSRIRGEEVSRNLFENKPPLKYLVNVNVLCVGFDAPNIDCVALLRPTMSPGLFYQMCGRGFRLHPAKQNCLVLDFGDNVRRHGPVDQIRAGWTPSFGSGGDAPGKECPECRSVIAAGYAVCPDCGFEFPREERDRTHSAKASTDPVISGEVVVTEHTVNDTTWSVHTKRGADESHPKTMRVDYRVGFYRSVSEWVCFEHTGWARQKAESWWRQRSDVPPPRTSAEAVELARAGALADTMQVTVRSESGEEYDRIIGYELGDKPDAEDALERLAIRDEAFGEEDEWGEPVYAGIDPDSIPF